MCTRVWDSQVHGRPLRALGTHLYWNGEYNLRDSSQGQESAGPGAVEPLGLQMAGKEEKVLRSSWERSMVGVLLVFAEVPGDAGRGVSPSGLSSIED